MLKSLVTILRVLLGLVFFLIGVVGAYDQSARKVATEGALGELARTVNDGLPVVSADVVTDRYDGQPVYVQGELGPGSVGDPLTGLEVNGVWLKRLVELEQWKERCDYVRAGSTTCYYKYDRVWSHDLIDSDDFSRPLFGADSEQAPRVNPKEKPFDEPAFNLRFLDLGAWKLDAAYYSSAFDFGEVSPDVLASGGLNDDWRAEGAYAYSIAEPTIRVRYNYSVAPTGWVSLIAIPREGVLTLSEELAGAPLLVPGSADPGTVLETATGGVRDIQLNWIFYTFVGLMLLVRPLASPVRAFDNFTGAPFPKRLLISAVLATAGVLLTGLLLP